MEPEDRPTTIHTEEPLAPRGPWAFLKAALAGGFTRWGWGLLAGWALVLVGPALGWAGHLRRAAGSSALPAHWGERISAVDVWELWAHGGLQQRLTNSPTVHLFGLGLVVVLWCGWRLQGEAAGFQARLTPWLLGTLDTLLIGLLPLGAIGWGADRLLAWLGGFGIDGLGWTALLGRPLVWMAVVATLNTQWWLCRQGRAVGLARGWRAHLKESFLALWAHPVQWSILNLGGAALRSLLPFLVLFMAWRMGGGTTARVWTFLLLQVAVTFFNGWTLGLLLRMTGRYRQHDAAVRDARAALKEAPRDAAAV